MRIGHGFLAERKRLLIGKRLWLWLRENPLAGWQNKLWLAIPPPAWNPHKNLLTGLNDDGGQGLGKTVCWLTRNWLPDCIPALPWVQKKLIIHLTGGGDWHPRQRQFLGEGASVLPRVDEPSSPENGDLRFRDLGAVTGGKGVSWACWTGPPPPLGVRKSSSSFSPCAKIRS